jgi:hypothetical protein
LYGCTSTVTITTTIVGNAFNSIAITILAVAVTLYLNAPIAMVVIAAAATTAITIV